MTDAAGFALAVVQPEPLPDAQAALNACAAVDAIHRAARAGAELVLFPEGYPGPVRAGWSYDASEQLAAAAEAAGVAVCWSRLESDAEGRFHMVAYVYGSDGNQVMRYDRSHPATGDVHPTLSGSAVAPGPVIPAIFRIQDVPCGLMICSELWLPEVARVLAVRGAEVILAPAGGGFGRVARNWRLIARARAIENQAYLGLTHNLYRGEAGAALIAGPEGDIAASVSAGLIVGQLDLERLRWLRSRDDSMDDPKPFAAVPGLLRARRPELYGELTRAVGNAYDYDKAAR